MTNRPRNRVVVFRLSQDEYRALQEACERVGARNLSEFARVGIFEYLQAGALGSHLNRRFAELEQQIAALQSQINHLLEGALHVESIPQS
jgi:hypothetical protein